MSSHVSRWPGVTAATQKVTMNHCCGEEWRNSREERRRAGYSWSEGGIGKDREGALIRQGGGKEKNRNFWLSKHTYKTKVKFVPDLKNTLFWVILCFQKDTVEDAKVLSVTLSLRLMQSFPSSSSPSTVKHSRTDESYCHTLLHYVHCWHQGWFLTLDIL